VETVGVGVGAALVLVEDDGCAQPLGHAEDVESAGLAAGAEGTLFEELVDLAIAPDAQFVVHEVPAAAPTALHLTHDVFRPATVRLTVLANIQVHVLVLQIYSFEVFGNRMLVSGVVFGFFIIII